VPRAVLLLVLVAACREPAREGTPCTAVAIRQYTLAEADLGSATLDPATRRLVDAELPALRDALSQACREGAWSPAVRECMVQAPDHAAFQACARQLTDDQRRAFDQAARGETPSP
jgi:hypothetical protein